MKTLTCAAFALTLIAAALPFAPHAVQAGTPLQRCENADGSSVYTDQACATLGATPDALPSDVLNRIASDEANATPRQQAQALANPKPAVTARRSATAGCARTPTQLEMDLRGSFALGDVNRLAESYHWVGMSQEQSKPVMQQLQRLALQPLEDAHYFNAQIGDGAMQLASAGGAPSAKGILQLTLAGESRQTIDFYVERFSGCYFIRF